MFDHHPFGPAADQNLLFGVLALEADFVDRDSLISAMKTWAQDRTKSLGEVLSEQGKLTVEREILVEALVEERLHPLEESRNPQRLPGASLALPEPGTDPDPDEQPLVRPPAVASTAPTTNGSRGMPIRNKVFRSESRYRVLRPHAKGGLGEVFVAEDLELPRQVALKEIQREHVGDMNFRARFVQEAEITGGLEHPGIVPIYSLGAYPDGRPYYAMRLVNGVSLREAIDRFHQADAPGRDPAERSVSFRQLLRHFVDICNAVGYAHSRSVIHRDLKPANIMLGQYGETLIIDWGLAKTLVSSQRAVGSGQQLEGENPEFKIQSSDFAVGVDAVETQPGAAVGTPAYMSPEQAAGRLDQLGPAADIYGLGATLYTVLTGKAPLSSTDRGELLLAVQQGEFPRPRQINKDMPAPLEATCLKAMALQPTDRYVSALEFAADVENWLADEPVAAYQEPWQERTRRFLRKHRTVATSAAAMLVVAVSLSSGAAILLNVARADERQARFDEAKQKDSAQRAEQSAQKAKDRAEAVAQFLVDAFRAPDPKSDGPNIKLVEVLEHAVEQLDQKFAHDPATRGRLLHAFGKTYEGLIMPGPAVKLLNQAREVLRETLGTDHDDTLLTSTHLAMAYRQTGEWAEALRLAEEVHLAYKAKLGAEHRTTIGSLGNLAQAYIDNGRLHDGLPLLEEVVRKLRMLEPDSDQSRIFTQLSSLATAYQKAGRITEALKLYEEVYAWRKANLERDHLYTLGSMHSIAKIYQELGRRSEAVTLFEETLALRRAKFGPDHPDTLSLMNSLAVAYMSVGRAADAVPLLQESVGFAKTRFGSDHTHTLSSMMFLANACRDIGRNSDALPLIEEVVKRIESRHGPEHPNTLGVKSDLAELYHEMERHQDALTLLQETLAIRRRVQPDSHFLARTLAELGAYWNDQAEFERAEPLLREALDIMERKQPRGQRRGSVQGRLGENLVRQRKFAEAEPLLIAGYEGLSPQGKPHSRDVRRNVAVAVDSLIQLYEATGQPEKAAEWRGKRIEDNVRE